MRSDPLQLTGLRRALHEALAAKNTVLAQIYYGALCALDDDRNPDRRPLCAHGMRELFEKLPLFLGLPIPKQEQGLKSRINDLRAKWEKARRAAKCDKPGEWDGEIGPGLKSVLGKIQQFFETHDSVAPKRRKQVGSLIEKLDPAQRPLPDPVKTLRVGEWTTYHEYFQGVAHHNEGVDLSAFDAMMERAEAFLIDQLRPRTFEDHRDIADRIRAAEGS